jgi:hypothetical protein
MLAEVYLFVQVSRGRQGVRLVFGSTPLPSRYLVSAWSWRESLPLQQSPIWLPGDPDMDF